MTAAASATETNDPLRRLNPRLTDADWLVLRGMGRRVTALARSLAEPGMVVIDYGCGSMPYRRLFETGGCRYLGADLNDASDITIDGAGRMAIQDASADLIVSFQVLEHVRDLGAYFGEIRRVLKPDGRLILSTHGVWLYHPHPEDHRRWTRQGLVTEMADHGFEVNECSPIVGPLAWTTVIRLSCWCYAVRRAPVIGGPLSRVVCLIMNLRAVLEDAMTPAWVTADNACVYITVSQLLSRASVTC